MRQGASVCSAVQGLNRTYGMDGAWRIACGTACLEGTAAHTLRYPILCGLLGGLAALREKGELVLVRLRLTAKR